MAELRATPMVNPVMGLLADRLKKVQQFGAKPFGYENPPVEMLMNLLGVPAVQQTMERMAYGEPLTTGRGMTTKPRAEAVEAAMTLLPMAAGAAKATKGLPVGASIENVGKKGLLESKIPSPQSLTMPDVPTVEQMKKHGRVETVPLSEVVSFQSARNWDKFNKGEHAGDLVKGYGDKPLALRLETGEYVIYDGNHRTDLAMQAGKTELPMNVIDVESYDPAHAGRKQVPSKISDDELLKSLLEDLPTKSAPRQEALDTAQRNAALPIEEGGLGLPKDNTPEMRAAAMGVATDAYHGSKQDITGLFKAGYDDNLAFATQDPEFASKWIGKGKLNQRIGAEDEIKAAEDLYRQNKYKNTNNELLEKLQGEEFNAAYDKMSAAARAENEREFGTRGNATGLFDTVYPVKIQANKTFNPETDMDVLSEYFAANDIPPKLQDLFASGNYMMYETKPVVNYLKSKGYDSMRLRESTGDNYPTIAVFNPETVRSRFAAFDPFRRDAETALQRGVAPPDLLAGVLPLGLLADEEQRKKIYELMPSLLGQ